MGDKRFYFAFLIVALFVICLSSTYAGSNYGVVKLDDCITWRQAYAGSTFTNFTSITYPNQTKVIFSPHKAGVKYGAEYLYTTCDYTGVTGTYEVCSLTDVDGVNTLVCTDYLVTSNGNSEPSGIVISLFVVMFLIVLGFLAYLIIYSIGHSLNLDFDILDLAYNYGVFFVIVGMYIFENAYLGNLIVHNFLGWIIDIGIWTNMVLPTIYFILTLTMGSWLKKRVKGVDF